MLRRTLGTLSLLALGTSPALGGADDEKARKPRTLRPVVRPVGVDEKDPGRKVVVRRAQDSDSSSSSSSQKRVVVVRNGETVVDETWVDGKKAKAKKLKAKRTDLNYP